MQGERLEWWRIWCTDARVQTIVGASALVATVLVGCNGQVPSVTVTQIVHSDSTDRKSKQDVPSKGSADAQESTRTTSVKDVEASDGAGFISETYPDGTPVTSKRIRKVWILRNTGRLAWVGRWLERRGLEVTQLGGERVRVPETLPGEICRVEVVLQMPARLGRVMEEWKMTDGAGKPLLPAHGPLTLDVEVVRG